MTTHDIPTLEALILAAAQNGDDDLDSLLQEAGELLSEEQFDLLCDKVHQIQVEEVRDLRGWKEEEPAMTQYDDLLTEEQWQRLIAFHRKRLGYSMTGYEEALQFLESVKRLQRLSGPTPEEIERIKVALLNMAESEPVP